MKDPKAPAGSAFSQFLSLAHGLLFGHFLLPVLSHTFLSASDSLAVSLLPLVDFISLSEYLLPILTFLSRIHFFFLSLFLLLPTL